MNIKDTMKTKTILISIFSYLTAFSIKAQNDSIFTNLTSYSLEVFTHAYGWEGLTQFEYLTVFSDDPMSDTLRVKDETGTVFASLWNDDRKTWLKVNSDRLDVIAQNVFSPYYNYSTDYPLDEYFLLYDFEVLDTVSVGDTVFFANQSKNVSFSIAGIDTIQQYRKSQVFNSHYG